MGHRPEGGAEDREAVRACLNLYAVLPNLADVVRYDPEMAALVAAERVTIRFWVAGGPRAVVRLADGVCTVDRGVGADGRAAGTGGGSGRRARSDAAGPAGVADAAGQGAYAGAATTLDPGADADVILWFASPAHLNKMFDGAAQPVPVKGLRKLGFLKKQFTQLTDRMGYYLRPTDEMLADPAYLAMNTRLTLNTAALALPILLERDAQAANFRGAFSSGSIALEVLPDGPSVGLVLGPSSIRPVQGRIDKPSALIRMRDLQTANAFLNGKMDTFAAVALGEVEIWGQLNKVDALSLVLDRIPEYLS